MAATLSKNINKTVDANVTQVRSAEGIDEFFDSCSESRGGQVASSLIRSASSLGLMLLKL